MISGSFRRGGGLGLVVLALVGTGGTFGEGFEGKPGREPGTGTLVREKPHEGPGAIGGVGPGTAPHHHEIDRSRLLRVEDIAHPPSPLPPPIRRKESRTLTFHLKVREVISDLAEEAEFVFWSFNQTVPGPFLRARVGDTVELTLSNHIGNTHDHSIDLHAVTGPGGGSTLTQLAPGESVTIAFQVLHPGVFVYHCASPNVPSHITNGLYGLFVVDPEEGLPPVDREFYVMQGEFYTSQPVGVKGMQEFSPEKMMAEAPEYIVWNGRVQALTGARALHARQGETIRIFVGNGGVAKTSNFHIIGEIFDKVYPQGDLTQTLSSVQTTPIPAGGAAAVELKLENAGRFILVDHALVRIDRGAYGFLEVEGSPVPELLRKK